MRHQIALLTMGLTITGASLWAGEAENLRPKARLTGLTSVGRIIVTAANDTIEEDAVRQAVLKRLASANIGADDGSEVELLVDIAAERRTSEKGPCAFGAFTVSVAVREPISAARMPDHQFPAITWRTSGSTKWFSTRAPAQAIRDLVESSLSKFVRAVASAREEER